MLTYEIPGGTVPGELVAHMATTVPEIKINEVSEGEYGTQIAPVYQVTFFVAGTTLTVVEVEGFIITPAIEAALDTAFNDFTGGGTEGGEKD